VQPEPLFLYGLDVSCRLLLTHHSDAGWLPRRASLSRTGA
jgi:hypothetical protein